MPTATLTLDGKPHEVPQEIVTWCDRQQEAVGDYASRIAFLERALLSLRDVQFPDNGVTLTEAVDAIWADYVGPDRGRKTTPAWRNTR